MKAHRRPGRRALGPPAASQDAVQADGRKGLRRAGGSRDALQASPVRGPAPGDRGGERGSLAGARKASSESYAERTVTLTNRYGLHMRPSKQVVELANKFPCDISIVACGQEVDAKSILGLIGLGAECGTEVVVRAKGERAEEAVAELSALLASLPELHAEPREVSKRSTPDASKAP